jgi:hypothetical protein
MENVILEKIGRLAQINCAGSMMKLGVPLVEERKIIVNYLKVMEVIEVNSKGGFWFVGDKTEEYKKIYKDVFDNF